MTTDARATSRGEVERLDGISHREFVVNIVDPGILAELSGRCAGSSVARIFELIFEFGVPTYPYNASNLAGFGATRRTETRTSTDSPALPGRVQGNYTIFEGTSEVQRLVIARSISGLHIR